MSVDNDLDLDCVDEMSLKELDFAIESWKNERIKIQESLNRVDCNLFYLYQTRCEKRGNDD
jgi:hypothetical protein